MTEDLEHTEPNGTNPADDAMDRRLRAYATRWRANLPDSPPYEVSSCVLVTTEPDSYTRRRRRTPVLAAIVVLVVLSVAAAAATLSRPTTALPPAGQPSGQPTEPRSGRAHGVVLLTGGPYGAPDTKVTTGTVRAVRDDGLTRTTRIKKNASYALTVPPGNYRIQAQTPQWNSGSTFGCDHGAVVHVRTGEATSANVWCQRR